MFRSSSALPSATSSSRASAWTETYAIGTVQAQDDFSTGNIGGPCPAVEICIESVPEYEYTVDDKPYPRGEMLIRGPPLFTEYYKNPEETKKSIDPDGWFPYR